MDYWKCPDCKCTFFSIAAIADAHINGCPACPQPDQHIEDFREHARLSKMRQRKARRYQLTEDQAVEAAQMGGEASEADDYRALGSYAYSTYCADLKKRGLKPPW
jgi:hypothetical protein